MRLLPSPQTLREHLNASASAGMRTAIGVAAPLAVGLGIGASRAGVIASLAALWTVTQELPGPARDRLIRMIAAAVSGPVGFALGEAVAHSAAELWTTAAAISLIAAVSALLTTRGPVHSVAGLFLLLGSILGRWLTGPGPWWFTPGLMLVGATPVVAMTASVWIVSRRSDSVRAVSRASSAVADVLAASGQESFRPTRRRAIRSLDLATDLMPRDRRTKTAQSTAALATIIDVVEISTLIHAEGSPVPEDIVAAVRNIGAPLTPTAHTGAPQTAQAQSQAAETLALLRNRVSSAAVPADLPRPVAPGPMPVKHTVRFTAALMVAIFVTALAAGLIDKPHAYWLPLSAAFIFKPDLGPVFYRAAARTAGTVAGVIVAAVLDGLLCHNPVAMVISAALFAAVMPAAARVHHGWMVFAFTPIIFVFLDLLGNGPDLLPVRVLDTAAGAIAVLLAERTLAPGSWTRRAEALTHAAEQAVQAYQHGGDLLDGPTRHTLRRTAFSRIEKARAAVEHTSKDLGGRRHRQPLEARLQAAEDTCDTVTTLVYRTDAQILKVAR